MHLSESFSCMCLWEDFKRESDHEKTEFSRRRQKRNQTAVQKVRNSEYLNGHKLGVYHIETNFRGEGRTLRKIQKRKGHLSWQQTTYIQIQNDKSK